MTDRLDRETAHFAERHPWVTRFVIFPLAKVLAAWEDYRRPSCPLCNETMGYIEFKPGWRCVNGVCEGYGKNKTTIEIGKGQRRNSYNDQR